MHVMVPSPVYRLFFSRSEVIEKRKIKIKLRECQIIMHSGNWKIKSWIRAHLKIFMDKFVEHRLRMCHVRAKSLLKPLLLEMKISLIKEIWRTPCHPNSFTSPLLPGAPNNTHKQALWVLVFKDKNPHFLFDAMQEKRTYTFAGKIV